MRKAGLAAICGALTLSLCPLTAVAATTSGSPSARLGTLRRQTPPSTPDGSMPGGTAPSGDGTAQAPNGQPGGGGADTTTFDYAGTYNGAKTADGSSVTSGNETISATESDQNALLAQHGGTLSVTGATVTKSGDDTDGDRCNFYGVNSIGLAVGEGSRINVSGSSLPASSEGSNGLFATDSGTVYANDDSVTTTADNSRGLDATYGGTIVANRMGITTSGDHSAAVATDRGGGDISLTNSTLSTAGSGSPLLYSTGSIQVSGVAGTATGSQIAGMEGLNTILINNSTLASTQTGKTASDPIADGIIIYQSTSGDAEASTGETATFQAANSTLTSAIESGSMFYLTNTKANVVLSNTTLDFDSSKASLVQAEGNDSNNWGTAGQNGANVTFTGIGETMSGNVVADTISSVDLYLTGSTTWTGATQIEENANGSTSSAPITVNVDGTSTWVVTDDCTVSKLTVADGGRVVDEAGRAVTIKRDDDVLVQGDSDITVTVAGTYSTAYDASGAGTLSTDLIDRSGFDGQYSTSTSFAMGSGSQQTSDDAASFSNVASDAYYAKAVSWAKANGVIHGIGGTSLFQPDNDITRADAVVMLYNYAG